jgi:hypothetical protein
MQCTRPGTWSVLALDQLFDHHAALQARPPASHSTPAPGRAGRAPLTTAMSISFTGSA